MAEQRKQNNGGKKNDFVKNVGTVASVVTIAANYIGPAVDDLRDYLDKISEERRGLVTVPELYSKEYPLSLEQATEMLESRNLKSIAVKTSLRDANPQYKDCFDTQVVGTRPRAKKKVEPGSIVLVKIVTQEVIDESKRLYNEAEYERILLEETRAKQKEQSVPLLQKIGSRFKHEKIDEVEPEEAIEEIEEEPADEE